MFKFHPGKAIIILILLLAGLHQFQTCNNPCYRMLRLHVLANSDDPVDQRTKLLVRDRVIQVLNKRFTGVTTEKQAEKAALNSLPLIESEAGKVVAAAGYRYPVKAYLGDYDFPVRYYGARVFPPGKYTAVRVVLGRGEGHNWWCVLFPPLCFQAAKPDLAVSGSQNARIRIKCVEILKYHGNRDVNTALKSIWP